MSTSTNEITTSIVGFKKDVVFYLTDVQDIRTDIGRKIQELLNLTNTPSPQVITGVHRQTGNREDVFCIIPRTPQQSTPETLLLTAEVENGTTTSRSKSISRQIDQRETKNFKSMLLSSLPGSIKTTTDITSNKNYITNNSLSTLPLTHYQLIPELVHSSAYSMRSTGERLPEEFSSIVLISGICLFGNSALRATTTDTGEDVFFLNPSTSIKQSIQNLVVDPRLSFFEIESAERLADTMVQLFHNNCIKERCTSIHLDIPQTEYVLYLMEPLLKGLISKELVLAFADIVVERSQKVYKFFRAILLKTCKAKGIALETLPPITRVGLLDSLLPVLRELIRETTVFPAHERLTPREIEKLGKQRNSQQKMHLEVLLETLQKVTTSQDLAPLLPQKVKTYAQLSRIGYGHNYLNLISQAPDTLLFAVESVAETPIFKATSAILTQEKTIETKERLVRNRASGQITAIYPLERYMSTAHWQACVQDAKAPVGSSTDYFQSQSLSNSQLRGFYRNEWR